jgi:hypothetical protein
VWGVLSSLLYVTQLKNTSGQNINLQLAAFS